MTFDNNGVGRRQLIKTGIGIGGAAMIAGCTGGGNDGGGVEFTMAGEYLPDIGGWEGEQPTGYWTLKDRLEEESDGRIQASVVGEGQICGETDCSSRVSSNVVEVGGDSIGNSTASFPSNDIFLIPYTFESAESLAHTLSQQETWEDYWIPFAQEYGVIPFYFMSPHLRQINIGTNTSDSTDEPFLTPDDIQGYRIRTTESEVSSIAVGEMGGDPVSVPFGDTLQGLQSGVVDGLEGADVTLPWGLAEFVGEIIRINWTVHQQVNWANVDWLKSLPEDILEIIADETKTMYEELVHMTEEIEAERLGTTDPPNEGTVIESNNIQQHHLDEDEIQLWKDRIGAQDNLESYDKILAYSENIGIDGEAFHEYLWDEARSASVPESTTDFSVDVWWDDYLSEV